MNDHNNVAGPIFDSFKEQGQRLEQNDGEIIGSTAISSQFLKSLRSEAIFYDTN